MEERKEIRDFRDKMIRNKLYMEGDKLQKKLDFVSANGDLIGEKLNLSNVQNEERLNERISFFPFTHGEAVENQRAQINSLQKEDLNRVFQDIYMKQELERQQKKELAEMNKVKHQLRL